MHIVKSEKDLPELEKKLADLESKVSAKAEELKVLSAKLEAEKEDYFDLCEKMIALKYRVDRMKGKKP